MHDFKKLYTLLQMIALLSKSEGYAVDRLARKYDMSTRNIYRYLDLLKECGFHLEKDSDHRYKITGAGEMLQEEGVTFSLEEAGIIKDAVMAVHDAHPLRNNILAKLFAHSDLDAAAELIYNKLVGQTIAQLTQAIQEKRQAILRSYHSHSSETIADRLVEPIAFVNNMRYFTAYEPDSQQVLQFKPDRVGQAQLCETDQQHVHRHTISHPDAFGMNGEPVAEVHLKLSPRAANLLKEEFPAATDGLQSNREDGSAIWRGEVKGFEGVGRFVLGLPAEVEALAPQRLIGYLHEKRSLAARLKEG